MSSSPAALKAQGHLQRNLGLFSSTMIVVGMVIGTGVFFKPHAIYTATGAPGLGLLGWVVAGVMTLAAGLTSAELAASIRRTGGQIVWFEEIYGPLPGYLYGWFQTLMF